MGENETIAQYWTNKFISSLDHRWFQQTSVSDSAQTSRFRFINKEVVPVIKVRFDLVHEQAAEMKMKHSQHWKQQST